MTAIKEEKTRGPGKKVLLWTKKKKPVRIADK